MRQFFLGIGHWVRGLWFLFQCLGLLFLLLAVLFALYLWCLVTGRNFEKAHFLNLLESEDELGLQRELDTI